MPTDEDGKEISLTEYLMTKVLKRSKSFKESESDHIGRAILTVFPSVECRGIQPPSCDPTVTQDIAAKQDCLAPRFNQQVEEVVEYLLQCVRPKKVIQSGKMADGPILAATATHYLEAVNNPDAIPCISDTWQTAITMRCKKVMEQLLQEYDDEMKTRITEVGLPLEEDSLDEEDSCSLLGLHRSIMLQKTADILKQVGHFITGSVKETLIAELETGAAMFTEEMSGLEIQGNRMKKVTGGLLFKYAQQNHKASRSSCIDLFEKLYQSIEEKMKQEHKSYSFEDLMNDLEMLQITYNDKAVGPAKWEVYDEKRAFIKTQEGNFKALQSFKKKVFDLRQENADANATAVKIDGVLQQLKEQMKNDTEMNRHMIEELEKQYREEMERLRKEELERMERMESEQRKREDIMRAQMAEKARAEAAKRQEQLRVMQNTMSTMSQQEQNRIAALEMIHRQYASTIRNTSERKCIHYICSCNESGVY